MAQSLLARFDEYVMHVEYIKQLDCTGQFLTFLRKMEENRKKWKQSDDECHRLRSELDRVTSLYTDEEKKLKRARTLLHEHKERADTIETERDELRDRLHEIHKLLGGMLRDGEQLANETKEKLGRFMNDTVSRVRLSTGEGLYPGLEPIDECNSTGDLLSDVSVSRLDDTTSLEESDRCIGRRRKSRKSDVVIEDVPVKRRRSARLSACNVKFPKDQLVATTTVSMERDGPITAHSRIEAKPMRTKGAAPAPPHTFLTPSAPPAPSSLSSATATSSDDEICTPRRDLFSRQHDFVLRTVLKPAEECCVCMKVMSFASKAARCQLCKSSSHAGCRDQMPLPCLPATASATPRGERAVRLADMVGASPPYVPALIVRCVMEIERRGLTEVGLYRVSGSEGDVPKLKLKLQRSKGSASLANESIPVVAGVIKDLFRSLDEPIITYGQWQRFAEAVREYPANRTILYQEIADLPAANRDTLAFFMVHLIKVSQSPGCLMTVKNLSIVLGPALVGYSSNKPTNHDITTETPIQAMVVESLLELGEEYWQNMLQKTPSTPVMTPKYTFRSRAGSKSSKIFGTPSMKY